MVHNSSWGFEGVHIKFKNKLESEFVVVISSDIKPSKEANTTVYDITQPPMEGIKNKFDVVINVSTMEEVNDNHVSIFNNLFAQVAPGGLLICTFDIPGLQIDKFNEMFGQPIKDIGTRISGNTSRLKNSRYGDLNCGFFIIEK
jgi:SAM-dependent methyltransferase